MRVRYSFSSRRTGHIENINKQREKYPSLARKIVKLSDIVLEVIDSRFIKDTRNLELEKDIKKQNKKIIFVLNKADMSENVKMSEDEIIELTPRVIVSCTSRKGIRELRDKIKIISGTIKKPVDNRLNKVTVGVVGYPNTGKSSLINVLTGRKSAKTGKEAGFTKGLQKVKLTTEIMLLDSPGIISAKDYSSVNSALIAKHTKVSARDYSQVKDPEIVVTTLMKEFPGVFEKFYKIDTEGDSEKLMEELGKQRYFLKKGGVIDEDKTARAILKDWQDGKIKV